MPVTQASERPSSAAATVTLVTAPPALSVTAIQPPAHPSTPVTAGTRSPGPAQWPSITSR